MDTKDSDGYKRCESVQYSWKEGYSKILLNEQFKFQDGCNKPIL